MNRAGMSIVATFLIVTLAALSGCGNYRATNKLIEVTIALNEVSDALEAWEPDEVVKPRQEKLAAAQNQWNAFDEDSKKWAMQAHGEGYMKAYARHSGLKEFPNQNPRPSQELPQIATEVSRRLNLVYADLQPDINERGTFFGSSLGRDPEGPTPPGERPGPKEYLVTVKLTATEVFYGKVRKDRNEPVQLKDKFERSVVRPAAAQ